MSISHVISIRMPIDEVRQIRSLSKHHMQTTSSVVRELVSAALVMRHEFTKIPRLDLCQMCIRPHNHPIHLTDVELEEDTKHGIRTKT